MADLSSDKIAKALSDVRRSYRVVSLYQKRILEMIDFAGSILPSAVFDGWGPERWSKPGRKILPSDNKFPLDGLPLFAFSVRYLIPSREGKDSEYECAIEVLHNADDGLDEVEIGIDSDLSDLEDPQKTSSLLYLYGWKLTAAFSHSKWREIYRDTCWPEEDDILEEMQAGNCWVLRKTINLEQLADRSDLEAALNSFLDVLRTNGFKIPR